MNPRITERDIARPLAWGSAGPGMAWHHIVPFRVLREVWNRLVDQHIATAFPEAPVALRQFLLLADRNLREPDKWIARIRAENTTQKRAGHHELPPLAVEEAHKLGTLAVWPAWNAVEGPRRRSDDPKDRYLDRFTCGTTGHEAARMRGIEALFAAFQSFIATGPEPGPPSLRAMAGALSQARPVVSCDHPIRYRPEMWTAQGAGIWRKRRDADRT